MHQPPRLTRLRSRSINRRLLRMYDQSGTFAANGVINASNPATVTFYPQSFLQGTSQNAYQATAAAFGTMYTNVAAHEIGHLMGIGDYPLNQIPPTSTPSTSVVLPTSGVNDIHDVNQKTGPTQCDIAQAAKVSRNISANAANGGTGSGGPPLSGGGGGSGNGGGCSSGQAGNSGCPAGGGQKSYLSPLAAMPPASP